MDLAGIDRLRIDIEARAKKGIKAAGLNLVAQSVVRVHDKGLDSAGNKITSVNGAKYSETPFWSPIERFANRSGIPPKHKSKSGKSVQLPEGYKSFREFSGRQTEFIDLLYTGELRRAYQVQFTDSGFQTGYNDGAAKKMEYAVERHGKRIIHPSKEEIEGILLDVEEAILA